MHWWLTNISSCDTHHTHHDRPQALQMGLDDIHMTDNALDKCVAALIAWAVASPPHRVTAFFRALEHC